MRHAFAHSSSRLALALAVAVSVLGVSALTTDRAEAQLKTGSYRLQQPHQQSPVGWSCRTADGASEWWAYIDGEYEWGTPANDASDPWRLDAVAISAPQWTSYVNFRSDVLSRSETQGKSVVFQRHTVIEETIQN